MSRKISEILDSQKLEAKEKVHRLAEALLLGEIDIDDLVDVAEKARDPRKAGCVEAIEFATKQKPSILNLVAFKFIVQALTSNSPRIKWEAAKVIGNTAGLFADDLDTAITNLLVNTEDKGAVVRWSAAFALSEIVKLRTDHNKALLPAIEAICQREPKNSVKKVYQAAVKQVS